MSDPVPLWWCVTHERHASPPQAGGQCAWHLRHECRAVQCHIERRGDPSPFPRLSLLPWRKRR